MKPIFESASESSSAPGDGAASGRVTRRGAVVAGGALLAQLAAGTPSRTAFAAPSREELLRTLKAVDARQHSAGDFRSLVYIEQKEKGKSTVIYEAQIFRRSADQRFIILFTKPRSSAGQGYLRVDKNLWFYDPSVGKWERRTERERIGGTNSRRSDFDESRLSEEYEPEYVGEEKLGAYTAQVLSLKAKPGLDLAFPILKVWIDRATSNVLKRQELALSGRLLRTAYFPKWKRAPSESKQGDVWYPEEARYFDEVETENQTLIVMKVVDLKPLDGNLFTKAWLESKSR